MQKQLFLLTVLCFINLQASLKADPWGKDADLCRSKPADCSAQEKCPTLILGPVGEALIRFHQEVISPCDGPRSHYLPSSSQYALDAMRKYGFFQGVMMGCDRLMRENNEEWVYRKATHVDGKSIKLDPVP